jgi:hypothetical protein
MRSRLTAAAPARVPRKRLVSAAAALRDAWPANAPLLPASLKQLARSGGGHGSHLANG